MQEPEIILTVAGSDSSGGAGIQADIKTISALGGYAASVITAVTAQNTTGVKEVFPLPVPVVRAQMEAVLSDLHPKAVKIGMIYDKDTAETLVEVLERYHPPFVVYDPVMVSTSGRRLMEENAVQYIRKTLMPLCTLVTPNRPEAVLLASMAGKPLSNTLEQAMTDTRNLQQACKTNVLLKGGHLKGDDMKDLLCTNSSEVIVYDSPRISTRNLHGTGCTLSSAIATKLAQGLSLEHAVGQAKNYISKAIWNARNWHIGEGNGPLCHFF